jgi:3-phosphoshikimate 1-carboxyvinyltransferase
MQERPIQPLLDALAQIGVDAQSINRTGCPPVQVNGSGFPGGVITVEGKTSSQFVSSLLMVAPLAEKQTEIHIEGTLVSIPYVDLTIAIMEHFGALVENQNYEKFIIPPQQQYQAKEYTIEPDASSASYFFAGAVLTKTPLTIDHLGTASKQGDLQFVDLLATLGVAVKKLPQSTSILGGMLKPESHKFTMHHCSDMVPTMAALAATIPATTTIYDVANIRVKETDRIKAMCNELTKLGVVVAEFDDGLTITGKHPSAWNHGVSIATYDDHRIAMSFGILQLVDPTISIENPSCVGKTYPNFWDDRKIVFGK